jgi:monofunctional biosynthetic peptidoglycan transglycosylase
MMQLLRWFLKWILITFFSSTLFFVVVYRFINPPLTPLMIMRTYQQKEAKNKHLKLIKRWVPLNKITPNMILAVVSSEDNNFTTHWGFDFKAIREAEEYNKNHKIKRGASTISQQTAKNVFLWSTRSYLRKGLEIYFTSMIELFWNKKRIMEVYLNVIEFGKGIYGIEMASQTYFHKPASMLTKSEAAMLAAILPSPLKRNPLKPTPYLTYLKAVISERMEEIRDVNLK